MEIKFSPGDAVSYKPKSSPAIEMKDTKVIGFDSVRENKWKRKYSEVSQDHRYVMTDTGKKENLYVIEHYFGWYPSDQKDLNPNVKVNVGKRYYFAYESELKSM
jgi:hypothetical protein